MPPERDELKRLLLENLELSRENNRLLRKLRRAEITRMILTLVYWAVLIVVPFYLYYAYLGSYVTNLRESYDQMKTQVQRIENLPAGFSEYFDSIETFLPGKKSATTTSP